jgi:hypothetical protein
MAEELLIRLLGDPGIPVSGEPVTGIVSSKAPALAFHLAAAGHVYPRDALAGLLRSDVPDAVEPEGWRSVRLGGQRGA